MKKITTTITVLFLLLGTYAQDDQTFMTLFGKICQHDSIKASVGQLQPGEDSVYIFHFKTPDVNKYGLPEYDFESFIITFDTGSNLMFKGAAYCSVEELKITDKKAFISLLIEGDGDRKKKNQFEKAEFNFQYKKMRWLVKNINLE